MINYPKRHSEFEVQDCLYNLLIINGYDVRGEVKDKPNRLDLVIFKDKKAVCLIEVKRWINKKEPSKTKQYIKYLLYKIPVIYCANMKDVENVLKKIREKNLNS